MSTNILKLLDSAKAGFIRILWCDNGNVIRGKAVQRDRFTYYLNHGVGISPAQQAVPVMVDEPARDSGLGPVGEIRLVPDLSTVTFPPYAPGHAQIMGDMILAGQPWPLCPRNFLKRMIAAAAEIELSIMAAFENEFYLLQPGTLEPIPADNTSFANTFSMDLHRPVIDAIVEALMAQRITVEQYYPESGPGQQEITTLFTDALAAADRQIVFRETVRSVAREHQLRASFVPKIFPDQAGSGAHLHFSLWQDGNNVTSDPDHDEQLSPLAQSFIAGILDHLPALMALTTPSPNSYRRIRPHCWSGAFRCWGFDNREAAIRVPSSPPPPSPNNIELKTADAAANPYLALGATIAAGLDGIKRELPLANPVNVDPGDLEETERAAQGIDALPGNLGESMAHLENDAVLLTALGPELARAFLAVRRAEWKAMQNWSIEEEVACLLERY